MVINLTIGEKIKNLREDSDMTQKELAAKIHKSVRSIRYYEHDQMITIDALESIADTFGISILELISSSDDLFKLFFSSNFSKFKNLNHVKSQIMKKEFNHYINLLIEKYKD